MVWKKFLRCVLAPLRWSLGETQDDGDPAPAEYSKIITGSNPYPFTDGATIRFRRQTEGRRWSLALKPKGGDKYEELGSVTFDAGRWSGEVQIGDGHDTLVLSQSRPLGPRRRRFLFGLVVDESSPLMEQEQGTWGAEEEEGEEEI